MTYSNTNGKQCSLARSEKLKCRTFVTLFSIYPTSRTPIYLVYSSVFGRFVVRMWLLEHRNVAADTTASVTTLGYIVVRGSIPI